LGRRSRSGFSIRGIPALLFFSGELRQRIAGITGKKAIVESTRSADATTQTSSNCGEQFPKKRT
jgi:hypothetical protein